MKRFILILVLLSGCASSKPENWETLDQMKAQIKYSRFLNCVQASQKNRFEARSLLSIVEGCK